MKEEREVTPKSPDRLNGKDVEYLIHTFMDKFNFNYIEAALEIDGRCVAKFEHYISDGPGFVGTVYVCIGGGGPEYVIVVAKGFDGETTLYIDGKVV